MVDCTVNIVFCFVLYVQLFKTNRNVCSSIVAMMFPGYLHKLIGTIVLHIKSWK